VVPLTQERKQQLWQSKLSQMNIAQFPWDPKPDPPPAPADANASTSAGAAGNPASGAATYTQASLTPQPAAQSLTLPGGSMMPPSNGMQVKSEEPSIKQEPGLSTPMIPAYNPANGARATAAQRAAMALENQFGQRAAASINALQNGMAAAPQQQAQQMEYKPGVAPNMQQQKMQQSFPRPAQQSNGLPTSQMDGASDASIQDQDQPAAMPTRTEIDALLHAQLAARAKEMEGGGLMLPLHKAVKDRSVAAKQPKDVAAGQFDGPDDDMDGDEDAINSDLDDPEEGADDDDEDEDEMGHMMLCLYDKVQRVKNKWCVSSVLFVASKLAVRADLANECAGFQEVHPQRRRPHGQRQRVRLPQGDGRV
jgi:transcription initiation factor TFIIA large subunit